MAIQTYKKPFKNPKFLVTEALDGEVLKFLGNHKDYPGWSLIERADKTKGWAESGLPFLKEEELPHGFMRECVRQSRIKPKTEFMAWLRANAPAGFVSYL